MEATQTQQTEKLIEEMLGFLDSSTDEEEENHNYNNNECDDDDNGNGCDADDDDDDDDDDDEEEEAYESAKDEQNEICHINDNDLSSRKAGVQGRSKNSLAKEIKKIKNSFPIWNTREIAPSAKRFIDPIWRQAHGGANKYEQAAFENDWNSKLESNCRRSSNSYVQEVDRAIYGDTTGHPSNGSADYFQAAQNYAIYGKDFLDFPENLTPLLNEKAATTAVESNTPFIGGSNTAYGNGLYPTPTAQAPESTTTAGVNFTNFGKQLAAAGASTAAYYQMCNGLQPSVRPGTAAAAAAGSTAYGMFLGNKVTYVAAGPPTAPPPLVYNQHSSTTANFISNSLANAALASSPAILYSNPMLTTTTQQYLNTFFKETQYLSGGTTAQGAVTGTTTGIYERLVYAQMLQQQIYHQTQQQAAAVAAMFQHKQRTARPNGLGTTASPPGVPGNGATTPGSVGTANVGLNLCARQAAMVNTPSSELLAKNVSATATGVSAGPMTNGTDDLVAAVGAPSAAVTE